MMTIIAMLVLLGAKLHPTGHRYENQRMSTLASENISSWVKCSEMPYKCCRDVVLEHSMCLASFQKSKNTYASLRKPATE